MKAVQFLVNYPPYRAGDIAGFEDKIVDVFVDKKIASLVPTKSTTKTTTKK